MSKLRETVCEFYVAAFKPCEKGREASHNGYCQHCDKYKPRAKERHINKKKLYNQKQRSKIEE